MPEPLTRGLGEPPTHDGRVLWILQWRLWPWFKEVRDTLSSVLSAPSETRLPFLLSFPLIPASASPTYTDFVSALALPTARLLFDLEKFPETNIGATRSLVLSVTLAADSTNESFLGLFLEGSSDVLGEISHTLGTTSATYEVDATGLESGTYFLKTRGTSSMILERAELLVRYV